MGDPKCQHKHQTVRVSSHVELAAAAQSDSPMASTYCCDRPACRADAEAWVREHGVPEAHIIPLRRTA
jgi:hypothetical protein